MIVSGILKHKHFCFYSCTCMLTDSLTLYPLHTHTSTRTHRYESINTYWCHTFFRSSRADTRRSSHRWGCGRHRRWRRGCHCTRPHPADNGGLASQVDTRIRTRSPCPRTSRHADKGLIGIRQCLQKLRETNHVLQLVLVSWKVRRKTAR